MMNAQNTVAFSERIVDLKGTGKFLDICVGDITACHEERVDYFFLSSFPDD